MKSCPTCNRTYPDDTLAFCLMDGSVLSAPYDLNQTHRVSPAQSDAPPTEVMSERTVTAEPRPALQSTIRAPAPPVVQSRVEEEQTRIASPSSVSILWLRGLMATRALTFVLMALVLKVMRPAPYDFVYPQSPRLLLIAGALLSGITMIVCDFKAGFPKAARLFTLTDAALGFIVGIVTFVITLGPFDESLYKTIVISSVWTILTGACLIAIAIVMRRHIRSVSALALSGAAVMGYGFIVLIGEVISQGNNAYLWNGGMTINRWTDRYEVLLITALMISGASMAIFAFVARGKEPRE